MIITNTPEETLAVVLSMLGIAGLFWSVYGILKWRDLRDGAPCVITNEHTTALGNGAPWPGGTIEVKRGRLSAEDAAAVRQQFAHLVATADRLEAKRRPLRGLARRSPALPRTASSSPHSIVAYSLNAGHCVAHPECRGLNLVRSADGRWARG